MSGVHIAKNGLSHRSSVFPVPSTNSSVSMSPRA